MEVQTLVLPEGALSNLMDANSSTTFTFTTTDGTTIPVVHDPSTGLYSFSTTFAEPGVENETGSAEPPFNVIASSQIIDGSVTLNLADVYAAHSHGSVTDLSNAEVHYIQNLDGTLVQSGYQLEDVSAAILQEEGGSSDSNKGSTKEEPTLTLSSADTEYENLDGTFNATDGGLVQDHVDEETYQSGIPPTFEVDGSAAEMVTNFEAPEEQSVASATCKSSKSSEAKYKVIDENDYQTLFVTDENGYQSVLVTEETNSRATPQLTTSGDPEPIVSAIVSGEGAYEAMVVNMESTDNQTIAADNSDVDRAVAIATSEAIGSIGGLVNDTDNSAETGVNGDEDAETTASVQPSEQNVMLAEGDSLDETAPLPPEEEECEDEDPNTVTIDISNPIPLCQNSIISVNGQKCVLQQNIETGELVAYPVKEPEKPRRRRGRPRKCLSEPSAEEEISRAAATQEGTKDDDKAADIDAEPAEKGLVITANEAGEIVKRSARKKKRTAILREYETDTVKMEGSSDEGDDDDDTKREEDDILPRKVSVRGRGRGRRPFTRGRGASSLTRPPTKSSDSDIPKRGRGRPRRYGLPPPLPEAPTTRSFLVQTSDGQTLMIHVPAASLTPGMSLQSVAQGIAESLNAQSTQMHPTTKPSDSELLDDMEESETMEVIAEQFEEEESPSAVSPSQSSLEDASDNVLKTSSEMPNSSAVIGYTCIMEDTEKAVPSEEKTPENGKKESVEELPLSSQKDDQSSTEDPQMIKTPLNAATLIDSSANNSATVIPLPVFMINKETPVKISMKTSGKDIEKYKCPRCDLQLYYEKQFQEHIAEHQEDVQKCKCCPFLSFDKENLYQHYRDFHPRCICATCNHTAEYAYIIKRHAYRHSEVGAKCNVCGKVYKDMYILKMHIKTVHMPADVLYECDECKKKFNRRAHLTRHLRTHGPDKAFKCSQCDYRGCERSDITKHALIHEEPKHTCPFCAKTFRHIKNMELHVKRHKGQRDYKCGVCNFYGFTFTDMRKHIERRHGDCKTLVCSNCGQVFASEKFLEEHGASGQCQLNSLERALQEAEAKASNEDEENEDASMADQNMPVDEQVDQINLSNSMG